MKKYLHELAERPTTKEGGKAISGNPDTFFQVAGKKQAKGIKYEILPKRF